MKLVFSTKNDIKTQSRLFNPAPTTEISNTPPTYYAENTSNYRPREVILRPNSSTMFSQSIQYDMFSRAKPSGACSGCGKKKPENPFK